MKASIEDVKKFWDDRPCNIRHSSKKLGTLEYFDEVAKKKFHVEPHILDFTKFPDWQNKKVLEIGCGLATVGINFALSGSKYTGIELSNESLEIAKKRFNVYGMNGRFYSGNAEQLSTFVPIEIYTNKIYKVKYSMNENNLLEFVY